MKKVFLVEWDAESARNHAQRLHAAGFDVVIESENGGRAYRAIRTSVPEAVVLDLRRRPKHGREVGHALRELKALKHVPIVCLEDDGDGREQTRMLVEEAVFTTEDDLAPCLTEAISAARAAAQPHKRSHRHDEEP